MKDVVGSTSEEVRMIKAIQRSVGALDNGWIGNQTLSDIAAKLGADCFPLNVELYGQPAILAFALSKRDDERIEAGYATLFALAIVVKIVMVQVLVAL